MTADQRAERDIRHARWLLERALPELRSMPAIADKLCIAIELTGQLGGDYDEGEALAFADQEQELQPPDPPPPPPRPPVESNPGT